MINFSDNIRVNNTDPVPVSGSVNITNLEAIPVSGSFNLLNSVSVTNRVETSGVSTIINTSPIAVSGNVGITTPITISNELQVNVSSGLINANVTNNELQVNVASGNLNANVTNIVPITGSVLLTNTNPIPTSGTSIIINTDPIAVSGNVNIPNQVSISGSVNVLNTSPIPVSGSINVISPISVTNQVETSGVSTIINTSPIAISGNVGITTPVVVSNEVQVSVASGNINAEVTGSIDANITNNELSINVSSGSINATIDNASLNTNATIQNSELNVAVASGSIDANLTNSSINVNVLNPELQIFAASGNINSTVTGTVDANITNSELTTFISSGSITVDNSELQVSVASGLINTNIINIDPIAVSGNMNVANEIAISNLDQVELKNSNQKDAFSRIRVSTPYTIFDSKMINTNLPLFWDDQQVSGAGTTSIYQVNKAQVVLAVSGSLAGRRVRQTKQRFNYQPGKSQFLAFTGNIGSGNSGLIKRIGSFDDRNGLFFESSVSGINVVERSFTSGAAVDIVTNQSNWNIDKLDGTGDSGIILDLTKTQIFLIDYQWLGVGRVRYAFDLGGVIIDCHESNHANLLEHVYMSTPNLPIRYEIINDGTGPADSLTHICSAIMSEGGQEKLGIVRYGSTNGTAVAINSTSTTYAIVGITFQSVNNILPIIIENIALLSTGNDNFEWTIRLNPTVASVFTYVAQTNSVISVARGALANTVTGGTILEGGFGSAGVELQRPLKTILSIGEKIDGTKDTIVLCARPLTSNASVEGGITWREIF